MYQDIQNSTSPFGGYDTTSIIAIKTGNYLVKGEVCITTGNIYDFFERLQICQQDVKGEAYLNSYENNLRTTVAYDSFGHVKVSGTFQEKYCEGNILKFEITTDQTFINETIRQLREIYDKYGDNKGAKELKT